MKRKKKKKRYKSAYKKRKKAFQKEVHRKPLRKAQINALRQKLIHQKLNIQEEMERAERETREIDPDMVKDTGDLASEVYEREFNVGISDTEYRSLKKVESALKLIKEGKYGICISCGKKIPKARLQVLPSAKFCIKCQLEAEKKSLEEEHTDEKV